MTVGVLRDNGRSIATEKTISMMNVAVLFTQFHLI
jgi:hypothetical protein